MTPKELHYQALAQTLIPVYARHGMELTYVPDRAAALELVKTYLKPDVVASYGGSMTLGEIGFFEAAEASGCTLLDRSKAANNEELQKIFHDSFNADVYFMSTNALTLDGKLVNVDGTGNRVAALIYGPKQVVIIAGVNKLCKDEEDAIQRVHLTAAPINCQRLGLDTPCTHTGKCAECHSAGCICCDTVVTRHNRFAGRIQIILVGEELGY